MIDFLLFIMILKIFLIVLNMLFFSMTYPMYKIMILIMILVMFMYIYSFVLKISWFFLLFIILMVGGLLVLFIYFCSLSNMSFYSMSIYVNIVVFIFLMKLLKSDFVLKLMKIVKESFCINLFIYIDSLMLMLSIILYMCVVLIMGVQMLFSMKSSFRSMV